MLKRKTFTWDNIILKKFQRDGYEEEWIKLAISAVETNTKSKELLGEEKALLVVIIIRSRDDIYSDWNELEIKDDLAKRVYLGRCIDEFLEPKLWQKTVSNYIISKSNSSADPLNRDMEKRRRMTAEIEPEEYSKKRDTEDIGSLKRKKEIIMHKSPFWKQDDQLTKDENKKIIIDFKYNLFNI